MTILITNSLTGSAFDRCNKRCFDVKCPCTYHKPYFIHSSSTLISFDTETVWILYIELCYINIEFIYLLQSARIHTQLVAIIKTNIAQTMD